MSKSENNLFKFLIILVIITIIAVLSLFIISFQIGVGKLEQTNTSTIIGGLLSLVGGFAGAMGAYVVARYQVDQEKKQEKINLLSTELPIYVGLSLDFDKIIKSLENFEYQRNSTWKFELNDDFFERLIIGFNIIEWDKWIDTKKINDSILLKQLLFFEESFKKIAEVMEYDIKENRQKALSLLNANETDEALKLLSDVNWYKEQKVRYYYEIYYCLQKAKKIQSVILDKISTIEGLIEGKNDIDNYQFFTSKEDFKIVRKDGKVDPIEITFTQV